MRINKILAAEKQLNIAIFLYFNDYDLVSAHTLAGAARNIVFDLCKLEWIKERGIDLININYKEKYEWHLRKWQNFFKHASNPKDKNETFELKESDTEIIIYDAINLYYSLTKKLTNHMKIYNSYFFIRNKENVNSLKIKKMIEEQIIQKYDWIPDKKTYYEGITKREDR